MLALIAAAALQTAPSAIASTAADNLQIEVVAFAGWLGRCEHDIPPVPLEQMKGLILGSHALTLLVEVDRDYQDEALAAYEDGRSEPALAADCPAEIGTHFGAVKGAVEAYYRAIDGE